MLRRIIVTAILLAISTFASADTLVGRVVGIADGDTFTLLVEGNRQVSVRLAEIDAPEGGQPYGNRSRQTLSEHIFGKDVRVEVQTTDRYGRTVGTPYVDDLDVCEEMVRQGAAWVYRQYVRDRSLFEVENEAREAGRGIWGLTESQRVEPWNWRRGLEAGGDRPDGCVIKGNINSKGERIYHAPGMRSYGSTRINESRGERWFCSEEEARDAGWRAPFN